MRIKKAFGKIYGAELTKAERRAVAIEIEAMIAENMGRLNGEIIAATLWTLHETCDFGQRRLKRFYKDLAQTLRGLQDHYDMHDDGDRAWLCKRKLSEIGVDVDELRKEYGETYDIGWYVEDGQSGT